ncbi:MAG TPA: condensation domain-containing protein, partial [Thermoanaerobaculia bacterium]
ELRFWRRRLGAHPQPAELPTDRPRPAVRSYRGAYHGFPLPPGLVDDLRALGRREGATLFMTMLAGVVLLLGRHTGAEQVSVGSDIANRHRSEIEGLIGCFVNLLVMRTDLAGEPTVRQLLARVRETALEAYAHQDLPFDRLVEDLAPGRSLGRNPLFQLLFVLHNAPMPELRFGGLELAPCGIDPGITRFDLLLMVQETAGGFVATWNYDTELFTPETVERLSAHWLNLLGGMVAAPDAPVQQIEMLTAAEREEQARQRQERLESAAGRLRGIRRRGLVLEGAE